MAVSIRGRPIRSLRMRGRNDSGEENVPLDLTREGETTTIRPSTELIVRVLVFIVLSGVMIAVCVTLVTDTAAAAWSAQDQYYSADTRSLGDEDIMDSAPDDDGLRLALLNEAKEVRAAGLRALRYLIRDTTILQKVLGLRVDYLIARCIDIQQSNEVERTQALRLVRKRELLEVMYDIFRLPVPVVTEDFIEALLSVGGPDLMDNYLALVLSAFISSGLLEGLVEVITSSDDHVSVRATILLGELLHMANTILPHSHSHHLHCLPTLMNMAASFDISQEKRMRASAAVNYLKLFHEKKKQGPKPHSLYLDHIVHKSVAAHYKRDQHLRVQKDVFVLKDTEEALMMILRDSHILNHKQNLDWNWVLIGTILKWPNVNLRNNKDEHMHKFVRRLLYFYKPSSKLYANLELDHSKAKQLTVVGCQFIEFLLESDEDGQAYLEDLVKDIVQWLTSSSGMKPDRSLQNNGLLNTLSQHYFLFLGTLSSHPHGVKMLEKCSVFQCLLNFCSLKNQDHLLKLTVSTLDYSRDGLSRVILSKILTAAADNCRLYATKHLRVLLRANVEFFSNWGMELLVTQLHDKNKTISMESLDILDEACEDKEYNLKYVDLIEEQLNEALTTYRKPVDGDNYVRRSNQRLQRPNVYLPIHLYGQLVHDKTGCCLLEAQSVVPDLSYTVRSPMLDKWEGVKQLKAALWALGNIGSSNWGLNLLQEENVIPDIIALAQHCEVLGCQTNNQINSTLIRTDFRDIPYSNWCGQTIHNHLEVTPQSTFSGVSGCSDAVSQGSASSTQSIELVLGKGGKSIPEDAPASRVLLRKEVLRLVVNLSSSVGTKGHETGLLTIKEKFPYAFDDICLYSEVSHLLAHCMFRLLSRRFIQELFQDVQFTPCFGAPVSRSRQSLWASVSLVPRGLGTSTPSPLYVPCIGALSAPVPQCPITSMP
ncbi:Rapamycin-insensitive companion of mTOR [Acipenser ruthenus]|uniref:Rapamycin-insensitive companion of mTOR n=1 Tax=Acipenser ruthenus TaxID=7906 RepID=A0A662YQ80_ACIRT|nr:Rapamycin-insensitive companion of mTOR [Acipenser ruthenus]